MQTDSKTAPRLLVSVRSMPEALAAVDGGADIIDVKEPRRGSLGMADVGVIRGVIQAVGAAAPVSVALGEAVEWFERPACRLPAEVEFVKAGLSHLALHRDWAPQWWEFRTRFDAANERPLQWIAVAYVDAHAAQSPRPDDVIAAAVETGCRGVLFDTYCKTIGGLLELCDVSRLARYCDMIHSAGMLVALAGRVSLDDIPRLAAVPADIIGVRSAACRNSDRDGDVDAAAVSRLRLNLERWFGGAEDHGDRRRQPGASRDVVHRP